MSILIHTDTTATIPGTYTYRVRLIREDISGFWSNEVPITIAIVVPPVLTLLSVSLAKISGVIGRHLSIVEFRSDIDLLQWEARAGGEARGQGLLVGSGGSLLAQATGVFEVEHSELTQGDLTYRITIYARSTSGHWCDGTFQPV